jgi:hypothetical protein
METTIEVNDAIKEEIVETNYETPAKKRPSAGIDC